MRRKGATISPCRTCASLSRKAIRIARSCPTIRPSRGSAICPNLRNCSPWSRVFSSVEQDAWPVGMGLGPAKFHEERSRHAGWRMWRGHSCLPRRHSCRRSLLRAAEASSIDSTLQARVPAPRGRFFAPVLLSLFLTGCIRQPAGTPAERLAVLRLENLSGDDSLGWVGRALSEIITAELAGAPQPRVISSASIHTLDRALGVRPISAPGISAESGQALASGATLLAYGDYTVRHGKLQVRLTIEDASTLHATKVIVVACPAGDALGCGTALARQISSQTAPYGTRNPQALQAYIRAAESGDATVMEVGLGVAIAADPDFVPPYRLLAQIKAQRQDRAGAAATLDQALARGNSIPELERARLELESAELTGNPDARQNALSKLVKLDAGDVNAWRSLGDSLMNRHQFRHAQEAYRKASDLEPEDVALLNSVGYAAG